MVGGMFDSNGIQLLRRQAFTFVTIFTIGITLTVFTIIFAPRKYRSQAKLLLKLGRENVSVDPTVTTTGDLVSLHRTYEGEINTALNTMASREILEALVDQVGAEAILRGSLEQGVEKKGLLSQLKSIPIGWMARLDPVDDCELAILMLQDDLVIKAAKESSVVDISYVTKTPELAQRVTQSWVDLYRAHHADINATEGSLQFFVELESELADSLDQASSALQSTKSKFGIVTVRGEQQTLESQVRWARSNLTETATSFKAAEARLLSLEQQQRSTVPTVVIGKDKADSNEAQDRMRDRLYQLEIDHQSIGAMYTETHPKYIAASQQVQEAKELFRQQKTQSERVTEGINSTFKTIEQQIALEKANTASMNANMVATTAELDRLLEQTKLLNEHENEVARLQRSVDILETQYRIHVQNREQARLAGELELRNISNVNVFQAASLEQRPVSPNKKLCALLGLIGSLMSAIGFATWREANVAGLFATPVGQDSAQGNDDSPKGGRRSGDLDYEHQHVITAQVPSSQTDLTPTRDRVGSPRPSAPR